NDIDARDLPATLRQFDPPDPTARAEIERRPVRWLPSLLLAIKQFRDLLSKWRIGVLPGVEPDGVRQPPVHGAVASRGVTRLTTGPSEHGSPRNRQQIGRSSLPFLLPQIRPRARCRCVV